jgi:hypothetical protein
MRTTIDQTNAASATRLARQLNKDPQTLAAEILRAGIQAIDDAIGDNCGFDMEPLYLAACSSMGHKVRHEYTITGIIERMSPEELEDAENEADERGEEWSAQRIIRERYSLGVDMKNL